MIENKTLAIDKKRRMYQRINCKALAKWSYFHKNRFFDAKITNFSRNGIYSNIENLALRARSQFIQWEMGKWGRTTVNT